jgi:hypothetical protein
MLVAIPSAAQAADAKLFSSSGRSYAWFDDANNRVVICDMQANDNVGAWAEVGYAIGYAPQWYKSRTVYNGCEVVEGVNDGANVSINLCDWVYVNGTREGWSCNQLYRWAT